MKRSFLTGLAILLPLALTWFICRLIINILTAPFLTLVENLFFSHGWIDETFLFISRQQIIAVVSKGLILVCLFLFILLVGFFGRIVAIHYLFKQVNSFFRALPLIDKIYKTTQETVNVVFNSESTRFSQVVAAPFPQNSPGYYIGFLMDQESTEGDGLLAVFVPQTPNPTVGYVFRYEKKQLVPLTIGVEEAWKYILSCGLMPPASPLLPTNKEKR